MDGSGCRGWMCAEIDGEKEKETLRAEGVREEMGMFEEKYKVDRRVD